MQTKDRINFLVVDDQQLIVNLVFRILKTNGYRRVIAAKNGIMALNKIKKNPVNFVITDWDMPRMPGIELVAAIRKDPSYFDMPILMISEDMSKQKILYAFEEGIDGYQEKPFSEISFIDGINKVLQQKLDPNPIKYQIQKLYALKVQEKYDQAINFAESLLLQGESNEIFTILSECYMGKNDNETAKKTLHKALEKKESCKAYHLLSKICIEEGKFKEAIEFLEQAYLVNPLNTDVVIDMGSVYLRLGYTKEAAETFNSLQDNKLSDLNVTNIGGAYLKIGDIEKASKYLHQANSPMTETIAIFNKYAIELRKAGRIHEAIEQYKRCLRIDPTNHILLLNTALSCAEIKDFTEAEDLLKKCLKFDPNYEDAKKLLNYVQSQI